MCGRFVAASPASVVAAHFDAHVVDLIPEPSFNVAPTDPVLAVAAGRAGPLRLGTFRWGLIPTWSKVAPRAPIVNARAETVTTKPAFRAAFARRRCIVPADGFYEWERRPDGTKQPWYVTGADGAPLAFAAIWETWRPSHGEGPVIRSCAIVTTAANAFMAEIHDRMPVILGADEWSSWLAPPEETGEPELASLLRAAPEDALRRRRVSSAVNRVANNDATLIDELAAGDQRPGSSCRPVPLSLL